MPNCDWEQSKLCSVQTDRQVILLMLGVHQMYIRYKGLNITFCQRERERQKEKQIDRQVDRESRYPKFNGLSKVRKVGVHHNRIVYGSIRNRGNEKNKIQSKSVDDAYMETQKKKTGKSLIQKFLFFFNNKHPKIKFLLEVEQNNQLPFLNELIMK